MNEDRCIMCNEIVPEGIMVCPICAREAAESADMEALALSKHRMRKKRIKHEKAKLKYEFQEQEEFENYIE